MADDVTLPGTGDIIAADDIGGKKYQQVKVEFGADGARTAVTDSAPLPVKTEIMTSATLTEDGENMDSTSTETAALDCSKARRVGVQVVGSTGTHATHVVEVRGSVDDTNYYALGCEVTGEGIAEIETACTKIKAKVKTAEGSAATAAVTIFVK